MSANKKSSMLSKEYESSVSNDLWGKMYKCLGFAGVVLLVITILRPIFKKQDKK